MKTYLECVPCFLRQALDSVRRVIDDEEVHELLLRETLRAVSEMDFQQSPPAMAQRVHRRLRELTGESDPYREAKAQSNQMALELLPKLRSLVAEANDSLETAVRLAIAGNIIDLGAKSQLAEIDLNQAIDDALTTRLHGSSRMFEGVMSQAKEVLYLTDNAGEIVFDRLLIEEFLRQWPQMDVTVAVRGFPAINDATLEDAEAAGLTGLVEVIDNGSDAPGTILSDCGDEFRQRFQRADLVIAKGQGNYETLSEVQQNIIFLLRAKCPVIAQDLGCETGSWVLRMHDQKLSPGNSRRQGLRAGCGRS